MSIDAKINETFGKNKRCATSEENEELKGHKNQGRTKTSIQKKEKDDKVKVRKVPQVSPALFYQCNTQLGPSYHTLLDTNLVNVSIKYKLNVIQNMMDCLYTKCIHYVTDCVMEEMGKSRQKYKIALKIMCLTIVSPNLSNTQQLNLNHIGVNEPLKKLNCNNCRICIYLSVTQNEWKLVDSLLHKRKKENGWEVIQDTDELVKLYILSQVVYEIERGFDESHVFFDFPDKTDFVKILWENGNAIGFYTIKVKDTIVFGTMESYEMTTLDTAYIRKAYRNKGFGLSLLEDVVKTFPDEDIAISTPVSLSMYYVVNKFLMLNPSYKVKLWEVSGVGSEGNRKLIYLTLKELFNTN